MHALVLLKHNRKLMNVEKMKEVKMEMLEKYNRVNQYAKFAL